MLTASPAHMPMNKENWKEKKEEGSETKESTVLSAYGHRQESKNMEHGHFYRKAVCVGYTNPTCFLGLILCRHIVSMSTLLC